MILFSGVNKRIDDKQVLKDINFNIRKDDFVFIYNENEIVINTLRKLLSGEESEDDGLIRILNMRPDSTMFKNEVGIVFKDNILLSDRTLWQNYEFIINVKDLSKIYFRYSSKKVLNMVNLSFCADLKPEKLLPHQLKRANIAQALLSNPSILILEDPTSGLDEVNSQAVFHLLEKINNFGVTIVFLTSDKSIFENKMKRVIYLNEGVCNEKGSYI